MGKLVVPKVFMDSSLMMDLAKRYDPITQLLKNHASDRLFSIIAPMIKEVFILSTNEAHAIFKHLFGEFSRII